MSQALTDAPVEALIAELRGRGLRLRAQDGQLAVSGPPGALTSDLRALLLKVGRTASLSACHLQGDSVTGDRYRGGAGQAARLNHWRD